jgi:hypothetical protein
MIVDFDRPTNGLIQISHASIRNVIADIETDLTNLFRNTSDGVFEII